MRRGFVDYYERMRKHGIADAVSRGVRFHGLADASARATRSIRHAPRPGREHTVLLWGDSFAQALSLGIREQLPAGTSLAQVATSACRPALEHFD